MSVRESFVEHFGEVQAYQIEEAAKEHKNGIHDDTGSDPFKWACCIVIGYQCVEEEAYRTHHAITVPFADFKQWCVDHGELRSHDGAFDYLAAFVGAYDEFMPKQEEAEGEAST